MLNTWTNDQWRQLFRQINKDCKKTGETVAPFSDVEYYTEQIHNLIEGGRHPDRKRNALTWAQCEAIAKEMAEKGDW